MTVIEFYLAVLLTLPNGQIVAGSEIRGLSPMLMQSEEHCENRAHIANTQMPVPEPFEKAYWYCMKLKMKGINK